MFRSPQAIDSKITPEAAMYIAMDEINGRLADIQKTLSGETGSETTPFSSYTIDLTVAHTNLQITNKTPFRYLQVYCDGGLNGISIRMGDQSAVPLDVSQIAAIPITNNPAFLYLTNDVRKGRSTLTIYWVRGNQLDIKSPSSDISMSELAVRLGSTNFTDRRGETIFQDDFEKRHIWDIWGNGGACGITSENARYGDRCYKLSMPAGITSWGMAKSFPYPRLGAFGLEVHLTLGTNTLHYVGINIYDGTTQYYGELICDQINHRLSVSTPKGILIIASSLNLESSSFFHYFKLVIDPITQCYVRAIVNSVNYDLKNVKINSSASDVDPKTQIYIYMNNDGSLFKNFYVDNIIVTGNEP